MSSETSGNSRPPLASIRGYVALGVVGVSLLVSDLLQRTVVAGAARLFPQARSRILTFWIQAMRTLVLDIGSVALGGARVGSRPRIASQPGVLVVMNHQSLLDIPLVVRSLEGGYPRIVTRSRYSRGIPVISHMVRLYQYPVVDPQATVKGHVLGLREAARNGETPLVIFPEGGRSRTGELGPWKRAGLRTILAARQWQVHLVVADGPWRIRSVPEFLRAVPGLDIKMSHVGPFPSPPPDADLEEFISRMEDQMKATLAELRAREF
jgi:1-acyl-sn-glycerol-3-phosphate acyltransferase